jgi:hypothetical protein
LRLYGVPAGEDGGSEKVEDCVAFMIEYRANAAIGYENRVNGVLRTPCSRTTRSEAVIYYPCAIHTIRYLNASTASSGSMSTKPIPRTRSIPSIIQFIVSHLMRSLLRPVFLQPRS